MKKLIMLSLIAVFAICSLVADINNVTFSSQSGSKESYHILGYGTRIDYNLNPPQAVPVNNVLVTIICRNSNGEELEGGRFLRTTNTNGFYGITTGYTIPSGTTNMDVIVESQFYYNVIWNGFARVDFFIDQAF